MPDIRRLSMLADLLEEFHYGTATLVPIKNLKPPEKFYLGVWYSNPDGNCIYACTLGIAAFSPEFQFEGLTFKNSKYSIKATPMFCGFSGYDAAKCFFNIEDEICERFFSLYGNPEIRNALIISQKIREYIKTISPPPQPPPPINKQITISNKHLPVDIRKLPSFKSSVYISIMCAFLVTTLLR